jgi:2-(1,2-epoxy-1,2-dihydrophenyl)acetyl-CoA isomerase
MAETSQMDEVLTQSIEDRVAVLTLNRPDRLNALNPELMRRLPGALAELAEDDAVGCVVLTGAGAGFCSGGDVQEITKAADDHVAGVAPTKASLERRIRWLRRCVEASRLLVEMPKPAIAMINGTCAGAGLSLAAACDIRFAVSTAKFVPVFAAMGLSGDYGGSWLWSRILGSAKARQLYLLGERRNAAQALAFGLVDRLYEPADLRAETMKVAQQLANLPGSAISYIKANLNAAHTEGLAASLDRESVNMMLARHSLIELRKSKS